ncbi:hypothetical protein [Deinococcus humi]|uniref:PEBP family protein n=1 Tax=Deinococcus humi TaxID=662880 RepID=A0A7W8JXM7_9DEIO|nr:hypothetical protein [Deinococcus humi]MBB5363626.1 hypothetical protein [Deinococcus humi]GGO29999.1 hypothetical protein GCM10008949_24270 [Deinococcus humi]
MNTKSTLVLSALVTLSVAFAHGGGHSSGIASPGHPAKLADYDIVRTQVFSAGTQLVFQMQTTGKAGVTKPTATGKLAGSQVYSYVWPTNLDSSAVGFEREQGVLALAATVHPDFDDTPLYDENGDGNTKNDGNLWHSHWVVLMPDDACGKGALKVKDIPEGTRPKLPATWPNLPILIDSPGYEPELHDNMVQIKVPLKELGFTRNFKYDGVTSALRVNANLHSPLLCVVDVFKVASGDLSLPGSLR